MNYSMSTELVAFLSLRFVKTTRSGGEGKLPNRTSSASTSLPQRAAVEEGKDW